MSAIDDLSPETKSHYVKLRELPNGLVIGVHRLMFHWTLHYGISDMGNDGRYCYAAKEDALLDLEHWSGEGDPIGKWHKHPPTGRRRNPHNGRIWHESEIGPKD